MQAHCEANVQTVHTVPSVHCSRKHRELRCGSTCVCTVSDKMIPCTSHGGVPKTA